VKIWVDAQLSPVIAQWLSSTYGMEAVAVRDLRLRDARDRDIFLSAREAKAIILTKDRDMVDLALQLGPPPQILWITCGNTSNIKLKIILAKAWPVAENLLKAGEKIVEISDTTG
jgi:predicted nuclease of predicted toxin-antitoxin system